MTSALPALADAEVGAVSRAEVVPVPDCHRSALPRWPKTVPQASAAETAPPSHEVQNVAEPAAYEPRRRDWQHLDALLELLEARGRISDVAIAAKLGVSHTSVWKWRRRPGFETWVNGQLEARTQHWRTFVLARAYALAMRGSIRHMDFLARVLGWYTQPEGGTDGPTIHVHVRA